MHPTSPRLQATIVVVLAILGLVGTAVPAAAVHLGRDNVTVQPGEAQRPPGGGRLRPVRALARRCGQDRRRSPTAARTHPERLHVRARRHPALRLTATVTLVPLLADAAGSIAPLAATKTSGHAWAVPWSLVLAIVVAGVLAARLPVSRDQAIAVVADLLELLRPT